MSVTQRPIMVAFRSGMAREEAFLRDRGKGYWWPFRLGQVVGRVKRIIKDTFTR